MTDPVDRKRYEMLAIVAMSTNDKHISLLRTMCHFACTHSLLPSDSTDDSMATKEDVNPPPAENPSNNMAPICIHAGVVTVHEVIPAMATVKRK